MKKKTRRNTELILLKELKVALETDLWAINFEYNTHTNALKSSEIIVKYIESDKEYSDSLDFHFSRTNDYTIFKHNRGPYESLKSIGTETITNRDLISNIISLYDQKYYTYVEHQNIVTQDILNLKQNFYPLYFNKYDIYDSLQYLGKMKPLKPSELKENQEYNYHLKSIMEDHKFVINFNRLIHKNIENILDELNIELNN